jgi:hypothetical protein
MSNDEEERYEAGGGDSEANVQPEAVVSFAAQIAPLFRNQDVFCMNPLAVRLKDYAYMSDGAGDGTYADHANARHVYARLTGDETPRMPAGGPFWSQAQLQLFDDWMDGGFQP